MVLMDGIHPKIIQESKIHPQIQKIIKNKSKNHPGIIPKSPENHSKITPEGDYKPPELKAKKWINNISSIIISIFSFGSYFLYSYICSAVQLYNCWFSELKNNPKKGISP